MKWDWPPKEFTVVSEFSEIIPRGRYVKQIYEAPLGWSDGVAILKKHGFKLDGGSQWFPAQVPPCNWAMLVPVYYSNPGVWIILCEATSNRIPDKWSGKCAEEYRQRYMNEPPKWEIETRMIFNK